MYASLNANLQAREKESRAEQSKERQKERRDGGQPSRQLVQLQQRRGTGDELIRTPNALLFARLASRRVIRVTAIKLELRFDLLKSVDRRVARY